MDGGLDGLLEAAHGGIVERTAHREVSALQPARHRVRHLLDPGLSDVAVDVGAAGLDAPIGGGDGGDGDQIARGDAVVQRRTAGGGQREPGPPPLPGQSAELG